MKYLFRICGILLWGFVIPLAAVIMIAANICYMIWHFKLKPYYTIADFKDEVTGGWDIDGSRYLEATKYYKTPYDMLIGKVSIKIPKDGSVKTFPTLAKSE